MKTLSWIKLVLLVSVLAAGTSVSLEALGATVDAKTEGETAWLEISTQSDFEGTDASVLATDASTVEVRVPGANFDVKGKRQLFRFETGYFKAASISQEGDTAILRFTLKNKAAGQIADLVQLSRRPAELRIEIPALADNEVSKYKAISEIKSIAIPVKAESSVATARTAGSIPSGANEPKTDAKADDSKKADDDLDFKVGAAAAVPARSEKDIPVLTTVKPEKKEAGVGLERLVLTLFVLCAVLGASLFGLKRWAATKSKQKTNTKIQILTQHHLGPKKSLAIIQVAGEALLIGITDQNISMLKTLALIDDEVPGLVPRNFNDEMDREITRDNVSDALSSDQQDEEENFAMKGLGEVRDQISTRLRGLRNLQ